MWTLEIFVNSEDQMKVTCGASDNERLRGNRTTDLARAIADADRLYFSLKAKSKA